MYHILVNSNISSKISVKIIDFLLSHNDILALKLDDKTRQIIIHNLPSMW